MCNLYAVNTTQEELSRLADALDVDLGNLFRHGIGVPGLPRPG
ncbi:putative SOS response-associated peptidase YedK [Inquilinus ginsengisoli]